MHLLKTLLPAFLSFAAVAHAAGGLSSLSPCLQTCASATAEAVGCGPSDLNCQCRSKTWRPGALQCVQTQCGLTDTATFIQFDVAACQRPMNSLRKSLEGQVIAVAVLSYALLGMRIYSRRSDLWWDDYLHIASALVFTASVVGEILALQNGLGDHAWMPKPLTNFSDALKYVFVWSIPYLVSSALIKVSVLCFYLRIFPNKIFRLMDFIVIGITVASYLGVTILVFVSCRPLRAFWDPSTPNAVCINISAISDSQSGTNIATEVLILLLPLPLVHTLQLPLKKKIGVGSIFAVGLLVIAVAIVRVPLQKHLLDFGDITYNYANTTQWANWETFASYFCATAPTLRMLLRRFKNKVGSSYENSKSYNNNKTRSGGVFTNIKGNDDEIQLQETDKRGIMVTSTIQAEVQHSKESQDSRSRFGAPYIQEAPRVHKPFSPV